MLGIPSFDGLRNYRRVQRAALSQLSSQYRLAKMKDDISLFVANGYLQVLLNKANAAAVSCPKPSNQRADRAHPKANRRRRIAKGRPLRD